jgi:AbrB family looped-hinge helix DNA binding protein
MKNGSAITTIDKSGRIVLPKDIREKAQFQPGMDLRVTVRDGRVEIEPEPLEFKIVQKGPFAVAVPLKPVPPLTHEGVQRMIDETRDERGMIDEDDVDRR